VADEKDQKFERVSQHKDVDMVQPWRETASYWARHHQTIRTMFQPLTEALIQQAGIVEGQSILDVAGGAGEPSLAIAEVVGPQGSVMCTDPVAEMLDTAKDEARARGLSNVQFRQCTADSLPFADNSFDAAVSRLGVMFFPDPLAGVREMLRVTRTAGKLALAVWGKVEANPYNSVATEVVARYVKPKSDEPNLTDAFRFGEPGKLAAILKEAGASEIVERVLEFDISAAISAEEFWTLRSEVSETTRNKVMTLPEDVRSQLAHDVVAAVREYFPNDQMKFPAQMIIVSAGSLAQSSKRD
jgi:ubiquinone/menaquinone biosynthesis C-methylase UbiE